MIEAEGDFDLVDVIHGGRRYSLRAAMRFLNSHFTAYLKHGGDWFAYDGYSTPSIIRLDPPLRASAFKKRPRRYLYTCVGPAE